MRTSGLALVALLGCGSPKPGGGTHDATANPGGEDTGSHTGSGDTGLASFEVLGIVTDQDGTPVAEATVMVGGQPDSSVLTDAEGSYAVWFTEIGMGEPAIVAAKQGYRSTAREFFSPDTPLDLRLKLVGPPDNESYSYQDPGDGYNEAKEDCSHCHTNFVLDWVNSKHAESAHNPLLQDLYAGVNRALMTEADCLDAGGVWSMGLEPGTVSTAVAKCYIGGGVLSDLNTGCGGPGALACDDPALPEGEWPTAFGACADCHAPGIEGPAGGRDLHDAHGLAFERGVHCDFCHKVRDIDMSQPPGAGLRLILGRPSEPGENTFEWDPVYFGPLIDVPNVAMGGSIQPKFDDSVFCAGCHEQNQQALLPGEALDPELWPDGLPIHSTYSEWEDGPYNLEETPCQFCHMPGDTEATNAVDIAQPDDQSIAFGFPRAPADIRRHTFRGPLQGNDRLIDTALYVSLSVERTVGAIEATVSVANLGCGHAIPTGEPMRALVMVVEAEGDCGLLAGTDGMTIPDTGGALAHGIEGISATSTTTTIHWPEAAAIAEPGQVVRAVRPSGIFDDYTGIGVFADPGLDAEAKGMEIEVPVGQATVTAVIDQTIHLSVALPTEEGDQLYLGDDWREAPVDGDASRHLAGLPGTTFSKVLVDSSGTRHVPHYKAVDIASDNRIAPGTNALTHHTFSVPSSCSGGEVRATVMYRPIPLGMARTRSWDATDAIIATAQASWGE
jgi:hypothetical protein